MATPNVIETINTGVATNKGLVVQGSSGQAQDLQEWQDNNGNVLLAVGPTGAMSVFGTTTLGEMLSFQTLTELTNAANGQTTFVLPPGAVILGISVRVVQALTGGMNFTGIDVKVGNIRFNTVSPVPPAIMSTDPGTANAPAYSGSTMQSPLPVLLPGVGAPATGGQVRVTAHFYTITPPTTSG